MNVHPTRSCFLALAAVTLVLAGCAKQERSARTTVEMMDDPTLLQMVLSRCNESGAVRDRECSNARDAVERLAANESKEKLKQKAAQAQSDFERAREQLRAKAELERKRQEYKEKREVDPYTLPLIKEAETTTPPPPMQGGAEGPPATPPST